MARLLHILLFLCLALTGVAQNPYTPWGGHQTKKNALKDPENLKWDVWYDERTGTYRMGSKLGQEWTEVPYYMTADEYQNWAIRKSMKDFYDKKHAEEMQEAGKKKFDFTDIQFNIGKAAKIFGPGGVRIKTQGSAELKIGGNHRFTDNPSLSERNRKVFSFNFDEKINLSLNGKVGDKINMDFNYNSEATFNYDAQNLKLRYEGKEDEIIKLVELGNVSMPTNSSLIRGAQSLFGLHTDLQFGKLKLGLVVSQKNSESTTVSSKGGVQLSNYEFSADSYSENRHFWMAHFFRNNYDNWMTQIPNVLSGVNINRVEIWVTNKNGTTTNTRNLVALTDLAEHDVFDHDKWVAGLTTVPSNDANNEYAFIIQQLDSARNISRTTDLLDAQGLQGGIDYEKIESARLLTSSEYSINNALGTISLRNSLQPDQVLAIAYEYTYRGKTYQVGEFSTDLRNNTQSLIVKTLRNTANTPRMLNWPLMMKNVYYLGGTQVQKDQFKLDIKFLSDTTGVSLSYLPDPSLKNRKIIQLIGLDRLDNNDKHNPNGIFDFVPGLTINASDGMVYFTTAEPFGKGLRRAIGNDAIADQFVFQELYDSTRTVAKQIAERNKYTIVGQFKATKNDEIQLGSMNIPQGSVVVTAGGVTLTEGSDYTVDYNSGIVKILNRSILDAGTNISCSVESNTNYGLQRKTMFGMTFQYDFSKNFTIGGTLMHLSEQPLTTKVSMGAEPLNNTIWGLNTSWKKESQRMTDWLNKIPFLNLKAPSSINFTGEFAQLIAGKSKGAQGNASYIDDFENTKSEIDVSNPLEWCLSSVPSFFQTDAAYKNDVRGGFNRARMAWYSIDPLFTRQSSNLTPAHIKADENQLSDWDVREVYKSELFPNKSINYKEANTLSVLNLAFYPSERGPYNLDPNLLRDGRLPNPRQRWGGMMRKLDNSDFEAANVEYIEFWMMDPFMKERISGSPLPEGGDLYINLGEVSEDILRDGKKFYESGMPTDGSMQYEETAWGRVSTQQSVTYAFNTGNGARSRQDVGYNGLTTEEEHSHPTYLNYLNTVKNNVDDAAYAQILASPSADRYHYFRGSDYDEQRLSILDRYKLINNPNGNSVDANDSPESYATAIKTTPDVEDINQDYTLNEYEKYYQYHVSVRPQDFQVGLNHIVEKRTTSIKTRNGQQQSTDWYLFRIPVDQWESQVGSISDFSSIRFMRMFLTDFEQEEVLRFATLNLVRGEWRAYEQALYPGQAPSQSGSLAVSAVNFEENNTKTPVNYVLPPGISREITPGQDQVLQNDEQALSMVVENLASGDARAVYKNMSYDMRNYRHLQMFVHANALIGDEQLQDNQMSLFLRLGTDYKNNYYEYEVPLTLTPEGTYSSGQAAMVWPQENMVDIDFSLLTDVKRKRNVQRGKQLISYADSYSEYDPHKPNNRITVQGNPSLGDVRTIMIGVRNKSREVRSIEVWANELRLQNFANSGGWAGQAQVNLQLSDLASVSVSGHMETYGFGGLEETVSQRRDNNLYQYSITTNVEAGKILPEAVKLNAPVYYSYSRERTQPHYNPLDSDMTMEDTYSAAANKHERDSIRNIVETVVVNKNFSITGLRFNHQTKRAHMPYDPANFSFSYAHSQKHTTGETTAWESDATWKWNLAYQYTTNMKPIEPWKKTKSKSKWMQWAKDFSLNYLPQTLGASADINRRYYELQERDMEALINGGTEGGAGGFSSPLTWSSDFLFNRNFQLRWDLTKALKFSFHSGTNAEIEQPYTAINKDLYPDRHKAWKDSVKHSLLELGKPLTYAQQMEASWTLPLNKLPILDWLTADAKYTATYNWARGTELTTGHTMGNNISTQRNINGNGKINLETLYNHWTFLKEANRKFSSTSSKTNRSGINARGKVKAELEKKKNKNFEKEVILRTDTTQVIQHNQKTKKLRVTAIRQDGSRYPVRFKVLDANRIELLTQDTVHLKLTVAPKAPKEDQPWFKIAQATARTLMMLRNVSVSYRNTYNLAVPGFLPNVGSLLGQNRSGGDSFRPGLDFAFGAVDDSYVSRAAERGWLLMSDSILTPATSSLQEELSVKATLEPVRDVKIDLTFNRNTSKAHTMQYMYEGCPTMQTGSYTQTTISIKSAFASYGSAKNGYASDLFQRFVGSLDQYQQRVQQLYDNAIYPRGTSLAGQPYDPANGTVGRYSSEVMIPAFLQTYTSSGEGLRIFPTLRKLLPNWTVTYGGLSKLNKMKRVFKSFNLTHGYKSTLSMGSYSTFSSYIEYMGGYGFVNNITTGLPTPSSMYDISTISVNESFAPLVGLDMTFQNNITLKAEYRKTRVLNLSMTSQQLTENHTNDIVLGGGYKIADFNPFQSKTRVKKAKGSRKSGTDDDNEQQTTGSSPRKKSSGPAGFAHSLNLRLDVTLRSQATIQRNILTTLSQATAGNSALNISFQADYAISRYLTVAAFYDLQRNTPLLTSASYPTITQDFGFNIKFTLTR